MRKSRRKNVINIKKELIKRNSDNTKSKDNRIGNNYTPTIEFVNGTYTNYKKRSEKTERKKQKEILKKEFKMQKKALKADKR